VDFVGGIYFYIETNGVWSRQSKLTAIDALSDDSFGNSATIYSSHALVGAYNDDDSDIDTGNVILFQ
jgi:hypothetical protein